MSAARRWRAYRGWLLLVAVPLAVFGLLYALPLFNLVRISFAIYDSKQGSIPAFQLATYGELLRDEFYLEILWRTIRLSLATTLISAVVGFPIAVYVIQATGWRQTLLFIVLLLPLVTSVTVVSYGWLILLGRQGLVNQILLALGLIDAPVQYIFSEGAIVVGLVHVLVVFMVISIAASLQSIDPSLIRAARSLGAGPWTAFRYVVFPLSLPGLRTGSLLVFTLSMSSYAIPTMIGGPRVKFTSLLVYQQAVGLLNWPRAAAMAVILLVVTTGFLALASAWGQFRSFRRASAAGAGARLAPATSGGAA